MWRKTTSAKKENVLTLQKNDFNQQIALINSKQNEIQKLNQMICMICNYSLATINDVKFNRVKSFNWLTSPKLKVFAHSSFLPESEMTNFSKLNWTWDKAHNPIWELKAFQFHSIYYA